MHKNHKGHNIYNIAFVGKDGVGKTTLIDKTLAFYLKRQKSAIVQSAEEKSRGYTIYNRFYHFDHKGAAFNLIDTPGDTNFLSSVNSAVFASTGSVLVLSSLGTGADACLRAWENLVETQTSRLIFVNMLDLPQPNFGETVKNFEDTFGLRLTVLFSPWYENKELAGVIDVMGQKLLRGGSGQISVEDLPPEAAEEAELLKSVAYERLAELDDELMEFYIEEKEAPDELLIKTLSRGVKSCEIVPVLAGAAEIDIGIETLTEFIGSYFPSPRDKVWNAKAGKEEEDEKLEISPVPDEPFSGFVFKTILDRYIGKLSFIRVISGTLKKGLKIINTSSPGKVQPGKILLLTCDDHEEVDEAYPGDIVILEKEDNLATNNSICEASRPVYYEPIPFLTPNFSSRLELSQSSKDSRVMEAVNKVILEDPALRLQVDPDTKEVLISGMGSMHLEAVQEYLKNAYEVEISLTDYQIAYRETIVGKATVQGKYKKQSGGHGQYGDVHITIEPLPRNGDFEFVDKIVGGAIPKNYIPSVEKGVKEALITGCLAGYPVVDVKVTLFDGTFHAVDSSDFAFQKAGIMGVNKGLPESKPVLLEPIMELEMDVLEADVGKITKDLASRRGKVSSYSYKGMTTLVHAEAPLAELTDYTQTLRGMTLGLGLYSMKLKGYEILAASLAEKVIAARKKED